MQLTTRTIRMAGLIVALCRLGTAGAGLHYLLTGRWLESGVALAALMLSWVPSRVIHDALLREWCTIAGGLLLSAHVVLGMHLGLYEQSGSYDKVMHFAGSAAIAALVWLALLRYCRQQDWALPMRLSVLVVVGATLAIGAAWEMFEFAVDQTGWFTAQRGLDDTMLDLVANTTGALLVALGWALWQRLSIAQRSAIGHH